MALVSTHTIPRLLDLLSVGKLETAALMITHGTFFPSPLGHLETHRLTAVLPTRLQVQRGAASVRRLRPRSRDERTESEHRILIDKASRSGL